MKYKSLLLLLFIPLTGCMQNVIKPEKDTASYEPVYPRESEYRPANTGSIYQASSSVPLFEDERARRVGDILTIVLTEKTNATKKATTSTKKENSTSTGTPTIFGRPVTKGGTNIFGVEIDGKQQFTGEGDSTQSNALTGTISVSVVRVLPNGNLVVRGRKRLTLNRGDEYINISGMVRAADIKADNTISSTLLANARITYSGTGTVADANKMGWLARFFNSEYWPF